MKYSLGTYVFRCVIIILVIVVVIGQCYSNFADLLMDIFVDTNLNFDPPKKLSSGFQISLDCHNASHDYSTRGGHAFPAAVWAKRGRDDAF